MNARTVALCALLAAFAGTVGTPNLARAQTSDASPAPLATPATLSVVGQVLVIGQAYLVFTTGDAVKIEPSLTIPRVRLGQYVRVLIDRTTHAVVSFEVAPRSLGSGDIEAVKLPRDYVVASEKSKRVETAGSGAAGAPVHSVTVTITVSVPDNTPLNDDVYLATDRTNFSPAEIRMTRADARTWTTSLQLTSGAVVRYEFTRGNFATIERDKRGGIVEPRTLNAADNVQTHDTVAHWADVN